MEPSYIKLADNVGKYFWSGECDPEDNEDPNIHYIEFNCDVPYCVLKDNEYVHIYTCIYKANIETYPFRPSDGYAHLDSDLCFEYVFSYKYVKYVDIVYKYSNERDETCVRPYLALLISLSDTRYLYIATECVEFESDSQITESIPEGCGDSCPSWYAFDANYMYITPDCDDNIVKVNKKDIDFTKHPLHPYFNYGYTQDETEHERPIINFGIYRIKTVKCTNVNKITVHSYNSSLLSSKSLLQL